MWVEKNPRVKWNTVNYECFHFIEGSGRYVLSPDSTRIYGNNGWRLPKRVEKGITTPEWCVQILLIFKLRQLL